MEDESVQISEYKSLLAKNSVAVNNGTSALITALLANGIGPGDEVIVPTFTFIATVNSVLAIGAKPILVDCDPLTFNAPITLMRQAISKSECNNFCRC